MCIFITFFYSTDADLLCIAVMTLLHTVLSSPPRIATSFLSELHRVKVCVISGICKPLKAVNS